VVASGILVEVLLHLKISEKFLKNLGWKNEYFWWDFSNS
jgi:hypothetical protein